MTSKKNKRYKIAFGIPAYNEERALPKCIRSIYQALKHLRQTVDFQITTVICENGSIDQTLQVATNLKKEFPSLHIRVLTSKKGMVEAEKTIIKNLPQNIDFIFKIDADTLLKEDALSIIIKEFLRHKELKIVGGHPRPISYKGKNPFKHLLDKILNARGYFPQSEIAKHDVKKYHPYAFSNPQPTVSPEFEIESKIYFHGRFFCSRGKDAWMFAEKEDRIGDDTFLTNAVYEQFGPKAIRVKYDAICFSHPITSLFYHYKVYARIWQDKEQLYRDYPKFSEYKRLCQTKLDWRYILSLSLKWIIFFLTYGAIKNMEELLFRVFVDASKNCWDYSPKEKI